MIQRVTAMCCSRLSSPSQDKLLPDQVIEYDFTNPLDTLENMTLVSIPAVVNDAVCLSVNVEAHACLLNNEPFLGTWEDIAMTSDDHHTLNRQLEKPLWEALERLFEVNDVQSVAELAVVGSPRTIARKPRRGDGMHPLRVYAKAVEVTIEIPFTRDVQVFRLMG